MPNPSISFFPINLQLLRFLTNYQIINHGIIILNMYLKKYMNNTGT
jgi:hypothetical protein